MLTLLLTRHATTKANEAGLWIGRMESDISDQGYREIISLKEKLAAYKIDKIYASPSQRVLSTAHLVTDSYSSKGEMEIEVVEALREIEFGRFEGKDFKWASTHYPEEIEKMLLEKDAYTYPEGESLLAFHERVADWLQTWMKRHQEGTYLICAHGGTIRSILSELLVGSGQLHWHFKIEPASLTVVTITDGYPVIETLNH